MMEGGDRNSKDEKEYMVISEMINLARHLVDIVMIL